MLFLSVPAKQVLLLPTPCRLGTLLLTADVPPLCPPLTSWSIFHSRIYSASQGSPLGLLSPSLYQGSHVSFQRGRLSNQGSTGHLGVPPPDLGRAPGNTPQRPWNDCRCCVSLPSECQVGREKKPTGDGSVVQAYRSLEAALPLKGTARRFSKATGQLPRTRAMGK